MSAAALRLPDTPPWRMRALVAWIVLVTLAFVRQLAGLLIHTVQSNLHSYIPLVPFITGYLIYTRRDRLPRTRTDSLIGPFATSAAGFAALFAALNFRASLSVNDDLALFALAYISFIAAGTFLFLGTDWMRAAAFPVAFLLFLIPLPDALVNWLEAASVLASADVSALFFRATGTPILRDGVVFALPTIVIRVAQECSGIRSSWVLFITSLLAADLLLQTGWRRILLVAFVIPLGIVRNAFRILVIGLLCVHIGPQMIDSVIHHRGGPLFFAISLVPLLLLVAWLHRQESTRLTQLINSRVQPGSKLS
jgi:exosortase C (VPDSG-CTERM-specific)